MGDCPEYQRGADYIHPRVVGTLREISQAYTGGNLLVQLPPLPQPYPPQPDADRSNFDSGKAFYVPPENYLDPAFNGGSEESLNSLEICQMELNVWLYTGAEDNLLGSTRFLLRRPPLILVHGINSDSSTWSQNDFAEPLFKTRIYKIDYQGTHNDGFDINWRWIALGIEEVLQEYRNATEAPGHAPNHGFSGLRYAATRSDVMAHSMGGNLVRLYISDVAGFGTPRRYPQTDIFGNVNWVANNAWLPINVPREAYDTQSANGFWSYIRNGNFGAGSIRRFVTVGTPFDGSPLADLAVQIKTTKAGLDDKIGKTVGELMGAPPQFGSNQSFIDLALVDLQVGGTFQLLMDAANYPNDHRKVRWHPLIGIAGDIPLAAWKSTILDGFFAFLPDQLMPVTAANGDLVVREDSQRNGQAGIGTVLPGLSHSTFGAPGETFNLTGETSSNDVAERLMELLTTYDPADWQGFLDH